MTREEDAERRLRESLRSQGSWERIAAKIILDAAVRNPTGDRGDAGIAGANLRHVQESVRTGPVWSALEDNGWMKDHPEGSCDKVHPGTDHADWKAQQDEELSEKIGQLFPSPAVVDRQVDVTRLLNAQLVQKRLHERLAKNGLVEREPELSQFEMKRRLLKVDERRSQIARGEN